MVSWVYGYVGMFDVAITETLMFSSLPYQQPITRIISSIIMAIGAKDIGAIIISSIQEMVIYPTTDEQEVMTTRMTGTEETVDQERVEGGKFHIH